MARIFQNGTTADVELGRRLGRALAMDLKENPNVNAFIDELMERPDAKAAIIEVVKQEAIAASRGDIRPGLFPRFRGVVRSAQDGEIYTRMWGLGWVGALISGIIGAGTSLYTTKLQVGAQKDIAKIQAREAMAASAAQQAEAEAQKAMAEAAMKEMALKAEQEAAAPVVGAAAILETKVAGIPILPILLLGGGALVLFMVLRKRK